jgi:hypothetical protein
MKFSRRRAKHLDKHNPSAVLCAVRFKTDDWRQGNHRKHNHPEAELQILDCSNRVYLHDFGSTRVRQLRKLDTMIRELQWLRRQVNAAWDQYYEFWKDREEDKPKDVEIL